MKIVQQIKFEKVWGKLEAKNCFQSQSQTNYLKQTLVLHEIVHYRKSSISIFKEFYASIDKIFVLEVRLGTKL